MPELELDAAVLGMEISEIILNAQPDIFVNTYYWSDARDVLCWINAPKEKSKVYVGVRVGAIVRRTSASQWNWVASC